MTFISSPSIQTGSLSRPNDNLELALLANWLDLSDNGLCVLDDTHQLVMINPAACNMLGVEGVNVVSRPLRRLLAAVKDNMSVVAWLISPGCEGEKQVLRADETGQVNLLIKCRALRISATERFKVLAISDITQMTELSKANEWLKADRSANQLQRQP